MSRERTALTGRREAVSGQSDPAFIDRGRLGQVLLALPCLPAQAVDGPDDMDPSRTSTLADDALDECHGT